MKNNKGITLIALVITIIVMLILVGVTISMAVNGGLFDYAGKATGETKNALNAEGQLANGGIEVDGVWYNSIDEYLATKNLVTVEPVETISKTESYVGYYADVDGNGTADGIIYADLAVGGSGTWETNGAGNHSFSYNLITGVKDYYINGTADGPFGNGKEVLTATGAGEDRFYVLALEDVEGGSSYYPWYGTYGEVGDLEVTTSTDFGKGRANTEALVKLWTNDTNEAKNNNVAWGQIASNSDWFVPSYEEWYAICDTLNFRYELIDDTYVVSGLGNLSSYYVTSSFNVQGPASILDLDTYLVFLGTDYNCSEASPASLRLSTTY